MEKYKGLIAQFARFVVIGIMNTVINFAILNILSSIFNVTKGEKVIWIAIAAFVIATINSYFFNKRWTFKDHASDEGQKFTGFLIVSIIGAGINSGTVYLITTHIDPMFGLSQQLWLNVAALGATGISLIWNFIGYKIFVFKK